MESSTCNVNSGMTDSEESGWTEYMVAFVLSEEERAAGIGRYPKVSGSSGSSDAASFVSSGARTGPPAGEAAFGDSRHQPKLRCMKRRGLEYEDELEDTATSPVCSPKISKSSAMSPSKNAQIRGRATQEKGSSPDEKPRGEGNSIDNNGGNLLRERGCCLGPFSKFVDLPG